MDEDCWDPLVKGQFELFPISVQVYRFANRKLWVGFGMLG